MDASLVRSILKALRDLGVQGVALILAVILATASDPTLFDAIADAIPGKWAGLLPLVFLIARVAQDQAKHRPNVGLERLEK